MQLRDRDPKLVGFADYSDRSGECGGRPVVANGVSIVMCLYFNAAAPSARPHTCRRVVALKRSVRRPVRRNSKQVKLRSANAHLTASRHRSHIVTSSDSISKLCNPPSMFPPACPGGRIGPCMLQHCRYKKEIIAVHSPPLVVCREKVVL